MTQLTDETRKKDGSRKYNKIKQPVTILNAKFEINSMNGLINIPYISP